MTRMRRALRAAALALLTSLIAANASAPEKVAFKPVTQALLKIDERPAKLWNVYQAEKEKHLLLVQLGRRFLLLDTKEREVYELDPASLNRKGEELRWEREPTAEAQSTQRERKEIRKLVPSEGWVLRDIGRARLVRLRLSAEGRVLEVQLPQQPDFRQLY